MVTSKDQIVRCLAEADSARSARRAHAATTVGSLARRHAGLAGQLAELERELGEILTAAGDVIDISELARVTDISAADLTRWREQVVKPSRGGRRKRTTSAKDRNNSRTADNNSVAVPRASRSAPPGQRSKLDSAAMSSPVGGASS